MEIFLICFGDSEEQQGNPDLNRAIKNGLHDIINYLVAQVSVPQIILPNYPLLKEICLNLSNVLKSQIVINQNLVSYQSKFEFNSNFNESEVDKFVAKKSVTSKENDFAFNQRVQDALEELSFNALLILPMDVANIYKLSLGIETNITQGFWHLENKGGKMKVKYSYLFDESIRRPKSPSRAGFPLQKETSYYQEDTPRPPKESSNPPKDRPIGHKRKFVANQPVFTHENLTEAIIKVTSETTRDFIHQNIRNDNRFANCIRDLDKKAQETLKSVSVLDQAFSEEKSDMLSINHLDNFGQQIDELAKAVSEISNELSEIIDPEVVELGDNSEIENPKEFEIKSVQLKESSKPYYNIVIRSHSSQDKNDVDLYLGLKRHKLLINRIAVVRAHSNITLSVFFPINILLSECKFVVYTQIGNLKSSNDFDFSIFRVLSVSKKKQPSEYRVDVKNNTCMSLTADLVLINKKVIKKFDLNSNEASEILVAENETGVLNDMENSFAVFYDGKPASN